MEKIFIKRKKTRKLILQSVYSLFISKNNPEDIKIYIMQNKNQKKLDIEYFNKLFLNIHKKMKILNVIYTHSIEKYTFLTLIEEIIIKIAINEILFEKNIKFNTIINAALELSNKFCTKNSHAIIKKILNVIIIGYIKNNKIML